MGRGPFARSLPKTNQQSTAHRTTSHSRGDAHQARRGQRRERANGTPERIPRSRNPGRKSRRWTGTGVRHASVTARVASRVRRAVDPLTSQRARRRRVDRAPRDPPASSSIKACLLFFTALSHRLLPPPPSLHPAHQPPRTSTQWPVLSRPRASPPVVRTLFIIVLRSPMLTMTPLHRQGAPQAARRQGHQVRRAQDRRANDGRRQEAASFPPGHRRAARDPAVPEEHGAAHP